MLMEMLPLESLVIDDRCLWSVLADDPESTSFKDVYALPEDILKQHPLYRCILCDGYSYNCNGYHVTIK